MEQPEARQPRNVLHFADRIAIYENLKLLLTVGGDGLVEYKPDENGNALSDDRLAAEMTEVLGRVVTPFNVAGIREDAFGKIRPEKAKAAEPMTVDDVADLIHRVATRVVEVECKADRSLIAVGEASRGNSEVLRRVAILEATVADQTRQIERLRMADEQTSALLKEMRVEIDTLRAAKHFNAA